MNLSLLSNFIAFESDPHTWLGALEAVGLLGAFVALFNRWFRPLWAWLLARSSRLPTQSIQSLALSLADGQLSVAELKKATVSLIGELSSAS